MKVVIVKGKDGKKSIYVDGDRSYLNITDIHIRMAYGILPTTIEFITSVRKITLRGLMDVIEEEVL